MLAAALRRDGSLGALDDLEQGLLDTLARNITRDGEVFCLARNLVDLVDVDDADLCGLDLEVGRRDELEQDVLDILTNITSLGKCRRIGYGKGNLQDAGKCLRKQSLAAASGTKKQDVALGELDLIRR
jgi:hypothetical protein